MIIIIVVISYVVTVIAVMVGEAVMRTMVVVVTMSFIRS